MLLVTFHGGSGGINNVVVYTGPNTFGNQAALTGINAGDLSELRGLIWNSPYLYVANGKSSKSDVLCFQPQTSPAYSFGYVSEFVAPTFSKKDSKFETSIAHPYSLAFDGLGYCYISNQDTNVVARAAVSSNGQNGTIGTGSQSSYLSNLCKTCTYLDGTFAGSEVGNLPNLKTAPSDILTQYGGLSVNIDSGSNKVQNSVRDVAIYGGVLFVCDEPSSMLRLYTTAAGNTAGTYLGSGSTLSGSPTHLALQGGGLYVSAGDTLYWSGLVSPPTLTEPWNLFFEPVLTVPSTLSGYSIGGIAFDQNGHVYIAFQKGKGGVGTGAISLYTISQENAQTAPVLSNPQTIASGLKDTPEFLLYLPG
jgi:hypothetical protein